jgi:hypothetical protein
MFAIAPAGNGGRCRFTPAALPLRTGPSPTHQCMYASVTAAGAALCVALLATGLAMPLVEWFALPERFDDLEHRPREVGSHFGSFLLALCGLDLVNDLVAVLRHPGAGRAGRRLCVFAVKALMLHALVALSVGAAISTAEPGGAGDGVAGFAAGQYAGQWGELAVGVVGNFLLLSLAHAAFAGAPSAGPAEAGKVTKDEEGEPERSSSSPPTSLEALGLLDC